MKTRLKELRGIRQQNDEGGRRQRIQQIARTPQRPADRYVARLAELLDEDAGREALVDLGTRFSVVTPWTSLIVGGYAGGVAPLVTNFDDDPLSVPWALGCFAANSAQQARLVGIAPSLASGSVALNSAAMYAGQAIGAAIGGAMVAVGQIERLHAAGLIGLLLSIGCSIWASRQRPPVV